MANDAGISIDSVDQGRQALSALRGYRHQLVATALAWTRLPAGAVLLVEVAEDYATVIKQALTAVQVKSGAAAITLRSKDALAFLNARWRIGRANPGLAVDAVFLTTASAGHEQGAVFPDGAAGIDYWRTAAREGADVAPLRAFLLDLPLEAEFKAWLTSANDEAVRVDLLKRVHWECGAPATPELERLLLDAILDAGERFGLAPSDAAKAKDAIVISVLLAATASGSRTLMRADMLASIEKAATTSMPNAALRRAMGASQGQSPELLYPVEDVPPAPDAVARVTANTALRELLAAQGCVWLHGATGLGKTSLALEVARQSNRRWSILPLRGVDALSLPARLADARRGLSAPDFGGLILDDLPEDLAQSAKTALSALAAAVLRSDGGLICTAYRPPPPSLSLGASKPAPLAASYLDDAEVEQLVRNAGGDPSVWAKLVGLFAGGGHPQLVAARIAGLKSRGWPDDERLAGIDPDLPLEDLEAERDAMRRRLIKELPPGAAGLLARLTICSTSFDRQLALNIGGAPPPVGEAGLMLDILVGPWIETLGRDRFRVSPLVSDAGEKTLGETEIASIHTAIVEDVARRRPVPGERLGQLFLSALRVGNKEGLMVVAMAAMAVEGREKQLLAQQIVALGFLKLDKPIFPADPMTSALLRVAQLRIAVFAELTNVKAVLGTLRAEVEAFGLAKELLLAAVGTVVTAEPNFLPAADWLALMPLLPDDPQDGPDGSDWTVRKFGIVWRITHLGSIARLQEFFSALDELEDDRRREYLAAASDPRMSVRAMIQEPWVADARNPNFDARQAVDSYAGLAAIAERWGAEAIQIECVGAQAVLLAEYASDEKGALAILDEASVRWPGEPRLVRELTKILLRQDDFAGAYARLRVLAERVPASDLVEQVYVYRDLGISAANIGDLAAALQAFDRARVAALKTSSLKAKATGLLAERVWLEFRLGRRADAAQTLHQVLVEADQLDPSKPRDEFVIRAIGHLVQWMINFLEPSRPGEALTQPVYGFCSRDPPDFEWPQPVVPMEGLWYQLEEFEAVLEENLGLSDVVEARVEGRRIDLFEFRRALRALQRSVAQPDPVVVLARLTAFCPMSDYLDEHGTEDFEGGIYKVRPTTAWAGEPLDLTSPSQLRLAVNTAVAWLSLQRLTHAVDGGDALLETLSTSPAVKPMADWLAGSEPADGHPSMAGDRLMLGELAVLAGDTTTDAMGLFRTTFRVWDWVRSSAFRKQAAPIFATAIVARWQWTLANGRFGLRQPAVTAPAIEAACQGVPGVGQLARLILAAEAAVQVRLGPGTIDNLRQDAGQ